MVGNLVEVSLELVLAPADAAGLVPVKLRSVERAVGQADAGHAFPLAPASRSVAAPQALKLANAVPIADVSIWVMGPTIAKSTRVF